jgi:hypothetical protein
LPVGPALIEPLNDDRREHPDHPAQNIRHPRNVRILPPSGDFHEGMIRKSGNRFSFGTNAKRLPGDHAQTKR